MIGRSLLSLLVPLALLVLPSFPLAGDEGRHVAVNVNAPRDIDRAAHLPGDIAAACMAAPRQRAPASSDQAPSDQALSDQASSTQTRSVPAPTESEPVPPAAVDTGVRVELSLTPPREEVRAHAPLTFAFSIRDAATAAPLTGLRPAAWLSPRVGAEASSGRDCVRKAATFLGASLTNRPAADLNEYYVLALNDDASISVVDPRFGFGGSQLLAMVMLESRGEDWALSPDGARLFVSMPLAGKIAVADTITWKVLRTIDAGPRPTRLALQPDGARLWALTDDGVTAIDTHTLDIVGRIAAPEASALAFTTDSRRVAIAAANALLVASTRAGAGAGASADANATANAVGTATTAATTRAAASLAAPSLAATPLATAPPIATVRVPLPFAPRALAFSGAAQLAYAADPETGAIAAIDLDAARVAARLDVAPGFTQLRFSPDGRYGFLPNPDKHLVHIFDTASNRTIRTAEVSEGPDQVTFSDRLAYIRRRGSDTILMLPLSQLATEGTGVALADFTGGQHAMGRGRWSALADSIVQAPDGLAVLVANPADRAIYYYKEGMAAPMGGFNNYSREPRAVLVVNRSLRERPGGVYATTITVDAPGRYDAIFFLDAPRVVTCFAVDVAAPAERRITASDPARPGAPSAPGQTPASGSASATAATNAEPAARAEATVEPLALPQPLKAGAPARFKFRLTDPATHQPLAASDVAILAMQAPGVWQRREPARAVGDGVYEAELTPPSGGVFYVWVTSASAGLPVNNRQFLVLRVE